LKLRRQTETVEQTKKKNSPLGIGLKSEKSLESIHVIESFIHNGQTYDCVDDE
jgi:hypothetical protein